ncbi:MAG: DHH family phosphoesterase [Nanoarchaeota archaeon]|nr:DHH family phosphoesterase [Nanoarchaeota archaeon]MBU1270103.1 DHH family phosphoesterase [Nanoarchaeota archaeon]MBU1604550.1 DHH family phosphoesterase [Nanoarchaeota archaeon]MBU2459193.1 DHH family phosphoesterase [Nanoarchaeota archaeon]
MALTNSEIEEIRELLRSSVKPLFFFDDDPDGVSSFIQLYSFVGDGKGVVVKVGSELKEEFARKVDEYQPDKVFILDIPVVSQDFLDKISQPVIWIDHHPVVERKKVYYYNPRVHDENDNRPVSYWAWQITKKNLWIAMAGCIGDWFIPDFKDEFIEKYPELLGKNTINPDDALFETKIGLIARIISFNIKGNVSESMKSVKILTRIEDPSEILEQTTPRGKYIYKKYEQYNKEYQELLKNVKITNSKLIHYIYPYNKNSFTSELSNELLHLFPDKFIIVGRDRRDEAKMSIRSKHIKVLPILNKALEGVSGYGGGHDYACGAVVKREDLKKFLEVIKKELRKEE